jgi:hypothetical protein
MLARPKSLRNKKIDEKRKELSRTLAWPAMTQTIQRQVEGRQINADGCNAGQTGVSQAQLTTASLAIDDPRITCEAQIKN